MTVVPLHLHYVQNTLVKRRGNGPSHLVSLLGSVEGLDSIIVDGSIDEPLSVHQYTETEDDGSPERRR